MFVLSQEAFIAWCASGTTRMALKMVGQGIDVNMTGKDGKY